MEDIEKQTIDALRHIIERPSDSADAVQDLRNRIRDISHTIFAAECELQTLSPSQEMGASL